MKKSKIYKLFLYVGFSNLFFERSIFVLYLMYKGLTISQVAIFQGIINIAMMVGEIPTGIIADNIGKKRGLLIGNTMMIVYYVSMLFGNNLSIFLIGAAFFGVGSTFISGTDEAYLYEMIPDKEKSVKYLGQLSAVITFSIGLAMLLGGYIQKVKWEIVITLGLIAQIIGIIILLTMPGTKQNSGENEDILRSIKVFIGDIKSKKLLRNIGIFLGLNVGVVSAAYILAQDLLSEYGMSTENVSLVFVLDTILSVLVFSKIESILNCLGKMRSLMLSVIATLIAFPCMNIKNAYVVAAIVLIISIFNNYFSTVLMDIFNNQLEDNIRATGISCFNMVSALLMAVIFIMASKFESQYVIFLSIMGVLSTISLIYIILVHKNQFVHTK